MGLSVGASVLSFAEIFLFLYLLAGILLREGTLHSDKYPFKLNIFKHKLQLGLHLPLQIYTLIGS